MLQDAKRFTQHSETDANRNDLVLQNRHLVHRIAHRFKGYNVEYDELVAAGMLGLVEAAATFDPSRGYQFSTHAWWHIVNAVKAVLPREAAQEPRYEPQEPRYEPQEPRAGGEGLEHAIVALGPRQAHVVRARLSGKTQATIARELGISGAAVSKLASRALVALREILERAAPQTSAAFGHCWSATRAREARCGACFDVGTAPTVRRRDVAWTFAHYERSDAPQLPRGSRGSPAGW